MTWSTSHVGELVSIRGGGTPKRDNASYFQGEIPWVTPKDMKSWEITDSQIRITPEAVANSATKIVPANTVLLVVRSGVLKHTVPVAINRRPVAINQDMKSLECTKALNPDYLARYLKYSSPEILSWVRATTADNFPIEKLQKLTIPLPPLNEQQRIAAILDKADALRRKRQEALRGLSNLIDGIFQTAFGDPKTEPKRWPQTEFHASCKDETAKSEKLQRSDYGATGTYPVIDQGQSAIAGWANDDALVCKSTLPVVVFGDHTRAIKFVDFPFVIGADGAKVLKPSDLFDPIFFAELLRRMPIPDLGYSRHMRELKKLQFPTPPIDLQRSFGKVIKALTINRRKQEAHLEQLSLLFASLQHRAFRGEL